MRALCLITIKPGTVDNVAQLLSKKRKIAKEVLPVTGRADICVLINGTINDITPLLWILKKSKILLQLRHLWKWRLILVGKSNRTSKIA